MAGVQAAGLVLKVYALSMLSAWSTIMPSEVMPVEAVAAVSMSVPREPLKFQLTIHNS